MAIASTCVIVGLIWDISWHRSIGRDTFWTPAHMVIYAGGIIAGLACARLVLQATFGSNDALRARSVAFWGFRGPIGAWVAIWGTIAMLTSAPFDNWWHNAYGLDVKVLSPPHALLGLGMMSIQLGALLLAASDEHARASSARALHGLLPAWTAGLWLAMLMEMILESRLTNAQHSAEFFIAIALSAPIALATAARGIGGRWPATRTAAAYLMVTLAMQWILPRFSATPLLGPIYNPISHMVAPPFPLLLIFPAIAFDLLLARWDGRRPLLRAFIAAAAFMLVAVAVQWPFSEFLVTSPLARSAVFAADQWNYNVRIGAWHLQMWDEPKLANGALDIAALARALGISSLYATITTRVGMGFGNWLARVRR